jgi:hypothetical protein
MVRLQKNQCSQNIQRLFLSRSQSTNAKIALEAENKKVYNEKYKQFEMKNCYFTDLKAKLN